MAKIIIYDKARVNSETDNGQRWVPKLVYIYKVVISVRMFVCPIITQDPLDRFASNFEL